MQRASFLTVNVDQERQGSLMIATIHIVRCPVCWSDGEMIHHDIRTPLDYSCRNCLHEWQIDAADDLLEGEATVAEPAQMPSSSRSTKRTQDR